jgi:cytochrome c oxidase subunit 3
VLFGIGTLFTVFLGAYLVLRRQSVHWPPDGSPAPPEGLWISTLLLLGCSAVLARAVRAQRRVELRVARRALVGATATGVSFLLVQGWLWRGLLAAGLTASKNAYGTVFYSLTGLHALHVVGGLAFLVRVLAGGVATAPGERGRTSLELCALYWHFMGAIWLVLFGALYVTP